MLNVLFFASLREQLGCEKLELSADGITDVQSLLNTLVALHPIYENVLDESILVAVNQEISTRDRALESGDEVAFFPPVTGG